MIPSQMLKGILEGCILKIISRKETYGYEIAQQLLKYDFSIIAEGTIYPVLLRLEKNEWISALYRESSCGPKRKYFSITESGKKELNTFLQNWQDLETAVNQVFSESETVNQ